MRTNASLMYVGGFETVAWHLNRAHLPQSRQNIFSCMEGAPEQDHATGLIYSGYDMDVCFSLHKLD